MKRKMIVVCATMAFLGLLSDALGIAAKAMRIKASNVITNVPGECIYPNIPAEYLGLAAAIALGMAQAIVTTYAGCICC